MRDVIGKLSNGKRYYACIDADLTTVYVGPQNQEEVMAEVSKELTLLEIETIAAAIQLKELLKVG